MPPIAFLRTIYRFRKLVAVYVLAESGYKTARSLQRRRSRE